MTLRPALVLLTLGVLVVHAWLMQSLSASLSRLGDGDASTLRRIEVAFVRELRPAEPPPSPAIRPRAARSPSSPRVAAPAPEPAASAPLPAPVEVPAPPEPAAPLPLPAPDPQPALATVAEAPAAEPPASAVQPAVGPVATAASASSPVPFEWPPSTRLTYTLTGDYRGPVHGTAQVEWLRTGDRYQVHLDVSVAPVLSRRMSSEGLLTEQGLRPQRYEEVTKLLLSEPRRRTLRFEPQHVVMANGDRQPTLPLIQDSASQFVQLTWLFTTQRERLQPGQVIEMPLALPRRVDRWVYDVQAEEQLQTPVGLLRVLHMKPRRETPQPGELVIESWFAPSLQYLPVRILIRQDAQTYIDLNLSTAPVQASSAPSGAPATTGR